MVTSKKPLVTFYVDYGQKHAQITKSAYGKFNTRKTFPNCSSFKFSGVYISLTQNQVSFNKKPSCERIYYEKKACRIIAVRRITIYSPEIYSQKRINCTVYSKTIGFDLIGTLFKFDTICQLLSAYILKKIPNIK